MVVLNEGDDEVGRDQTNNSASHIHNRYGAEAHGAYFCKSLNLTHTFDDLDKLGVFVQEILHTNVFVSFRHVIPQEWHLFRSNCIVIQTAITSLGGT